MKNLTFGILFVLVTAAQAATGPRIVDVRDLAKAENAGVAESLKSGSLPPDVVVQFPAGYTVPVSEKVTGDLLSSSPTPAVPMQITARATFLVRRQSGAWLFSLDGQSWRPLQGFVSGVLSVGFSVSDSRPALVIGLEVNQRTR